jgi:hypothetical protein
VVQHVEPVPEHGPLTWTTWSVSRVLLRGQQRRHRGQADAADRGRRWRRGQRPAAGSRLQRRPDDRLVRREVGLREQATAPGHVAAYQLGQFAVVEHTGSVGGDQLERCDEVGLTIRPVGAALGVVEDRPVASQPKMSSWCSPGSTGPPRPGCSRRAT